MDNFGNGYSKVIALLGLFFVYLAPSLSFAADEKLEDDFASTSNTQSESKSFHGLKFGVGLALTFPTFDWDNPEILAAEIDGNNIVRVTEESKRTTKVVFESHYFFSPAGYMEDLGCTEGTCGHGPYVAIESGSGSDPIKSYSLGYMVGFKRKSDDKNSTSSWNIGIGYVATPKVQLLGHGIEVNEELPENDQLRFRTESRAGVMVLTSFSF